MLVDMRDILAAAAFPDNPAVHEEFGIEPPTTPPGTKPGGCGHAREAEAADTTG
jgi:hypothetical protein